MSDRVDKKDGNVLVKSTGSKAVETRDRYMNRFPTILGMNVWDDMFGGFFNEFDKFFGRDQTVPCDVIQNKDQSGNIVSTDIQYALAGYDKENIAIDVKDNRLFLTVEKTEETDDSAKEYLHKGISHRRIEVAYDLSGYDKDAIAANFENGVLKLSLPVNKESGVKKIEIK